MSPHQRQMQSLMTLRDTKMKAEGNRTHLLPPPPTGQARQALPKWSLRKVRRRLPPPNSLNHPLERSRVARLQR